MDIRYRKRICIPCRLYSSQPTVDTRLLCIWFILFSLIKTISLFTEHRNIRSASQKRINKLLCPSQRASRTISDRRERTVSHLRQDPARVQTQKDWMFLLNAILSLLLQMKTYQFLF